MALCPANQAEPGLETVAPPGALVAGALYPSANISYALLPHIACIVLPDFTRSLSADGVSIATPNHLS